VPGLQLFVVAGLGINTLEICGPVKELLPKKCYYKSLPEGTLQNNHAFFKLCDHFK
jgi:hypothetical protein